MNNDQSVQASFWVMVALQTIGSVDMPGYGNRKLPAPRQYVAIIIAWSILQVVSDAGQDRSAGVIGWVMVLVGMIAGPFGSRTISFLNNTASTFSNLAPASSSASATVTPPPNVRA